MQKFGVYCFQATSVDVWENLKPLCRNAYPLLRGVVRVDFIQATNELVGHGMTYGSVSSVVNTTNQTWSSRVQ